MRGGVAALFAVSVLLGAQVAQAEIVPRTGMAAGSVISRKSGEEIRFIDISSWQSVDVEQDLLAGDILRTNAIGHLAVLFSDRTQLRLGRNTTLLVKQIGAVSDSVFSLQAGALWGRAERGGTGLTVETPAAAAAVRGTDFSLTVEGDQTSLIVLEGEVSLSNEFGSVNVAGGEAAVARIGEAPTKVVIVDPDDRAQMLFYLTLRGAFTFLPASPLGAADMRGEHARLTAQPPETRSSEDWVSLAETALSVAGRQAATDALAEARRRPLTPPQRARLDLVEAMILGSRRQYAEAAAMFARAQPGLDAERRAVAAYGGYFARALADPERVEQPPAAMGGPYGALAQAYTAGFLRDIAGAIEEVKKAEQRYPDDPTLPAVRAQLALLLDDREQVGDAVERALRLDPDNPTALEARANYRAGVESDLDGALEDLERAAEIAPGSSSIWNALGLVQSERGAAREAEAALKTAIELDPEDPVSHANLAIHYLEQDRVAEAKEEIDKAIAADPTFDIALIARGRYYLQTGELDKATADLLAGTTANPAYAQGLLLLAAGYYESGAREPAAQALENADRLDPNDPVVSSFRTAVAIDDYDADGAIASAQEAVRRSRARGGDYAPLSANRDAGSLLNNAFRLQELNAWGRFYGDAVFDPFAGATFVDQAVSGSPNPFAADINPGTLMVEPGVTGQGFSSLFQGLMLSPEMISGRSRSANLFRRPFIEGSLTGGFIRPADGEGWTGEGEVQAYAADPVPWNLYLKGSYRDSDEFRERISPGTAIPYVGFNLGFEDISGLGYLTARPTPNDRLVAYFDATRPQALLSDAIILVDDPLIPFSGIAYDRTVDLWGARAGVGWSHTFGYKNVLNAAFFASDLSQSSTEQGTLFDATLAPIGTQVLDASVDQRSYLGAISHTVATGDLTWRYGIEAGTLDQSRTENSVIVLPPLAPEVTTDTRDLALTFGRIYADLIWDIGPDLKAEAALFGTAFEGSLDLQRLEPRVGAAWSPLDGHWLSAGFIRETNGINDTTLSPIGIVSLQPNQTPLDIGGFADTYAVRWNAEWMSRFFTSVDYQHQDLRGLSIPIPGGITTIDLVEGRIDRVSATANVKLDRGFGLFGTVAFADSSNLDPTSVGFGNPLPFVPETSARVGVSWVHPANVKFTLAATYVGERAGTEAGDMLSDYWTADAFLTWEPFDKRFALELAAYNLLNADFDVASATPGWGRSFTGSLKVRF